MKNTQKQTQTLFASRQIKNKCWQGSLWVPRKGKNEPCGRSMRCRKRGKQCRTERRRPQEQGTSAIRENLAMPAGSEENSAEHLDKFLDKPISAHPGLHFFVVPFWGGPSGITFGPSGTTFGPSGTTLGPSGNTLGPSGTTFWEHFWPIRDCFVVPDGSFFGVPVFWV